MSYIQKQGQDAAWEKGVMRNLATDVILYGKIQTTEYKAKKLKSIIDKLITFGKKGTVAARREVAKFLRNELQLIGRSVIVLDKNNKVKYIEICENVSDHPNYNAAFKIINS